MRKKIKNLLKKVLIVCSISLSGLCALTSVRAEVAYAKEVMPRGIYFEIDKNPIEEVEIKAEKETLEAHCGEEIGLTVVIYPSNAANTVINTTYRILSGREYAKVENGILYIDEDAVIGSTIEVKAVVDGVESDNSLAFTVVRTPVERVEIVNEETEIQLGGALLIATKVYPENATENYVTYSVIEGGEYAKVSYNGVLSCAYNPNIEEGSLVTVRATSVSDPTVYCEKTLTICKPVMEIVEVSADLYGVEQQRTYLFNMEREPYASFFSDKATYYSLNVDPIIATIDLTGLLHIAPTAPLGTKITVYIDSGDGTHYEQDFEIVPVYATAFFPIVTTPPSLQWNEQEYYLPGDAVQFDIESFQPINVSDINKICELRVNDSSLAYVDGDTIIIKDAESIKQKNPCLTVTVYSEPNNLAQVFEIYIYMPVTGVAIEQKEVTVKENNRYALDELFTYSAAPSNSMPQVTKYEVVGVDAAIAEIKNNELIIHDDLPAGEIKVGVYVDIDGVHSETVYFDVYKPTRMLELNADNVTPISAKSMADTVTLFTSVSETASINEPEIRIVQGNAYVDGEIKYAGLTENGLAKWQFTLKKDLAHYEEEGGISPIRIEAEQDGVVSAVLQLEVHIPNEDLLAVSAEIKRGTAYAINFEHTPNASTTEVEWRISNVISKLDNISVDKVVGSNNEFFVPENLSAGDEIWIEYRSVDNLFYGEDGEWKEAVYTVEKLSDEESTMSTLVYNGGVKADTGFSVVYTTDSANVVIGKNNTLPQLYVGRTAKIQVYYRGKTLSSNGMAIKDVQLVGTTAEQTAKTTYDEDSFTVEMDENAVGNSKVQFIITIQDGKEEYKEINAGTLYCFRPMSGELIFKTVTENNCKMIDLIDPEASKINGTFDYTASNGVGDLTFEPLSDDVDKNVMKTNGVFTLKSYAASKTQTIKYYYTSTYNGVNQDPYYRETEIVLKTVVVNKNGGDGGYDELVALKRMVGISGKLSDVAPSREGYVIVGYGDYIDSTGKVVKDYHDCDQLSVKWVYIPILTIIENNTNVTVKYTETGEEVSSGARVPEGTKLSITVSANSGYTNPWTNPSGNISMPCEDLTINSGAEKTCVATGTLITLADGTQKAVEELDGSEQLLVWNFHTGTFDTGIILFIDTHGEQEYTVTHLRFEDGTVVDIIDEHGFWDVDLNEYVYLTDENAVEYVGHRFNKQYTDENGVLCYTSVRLVAAVNEQMITNAYSPVTYSYLCYYVDGILSVPSDTQGLTNYFEVNDETMQYDNDAMQRDIELYGLFSYEDFESAVPVEIFDAMNGQYLKVSLGKGLITEEYILWLIEAYSKYFEWEDNIQ